MDWCHAVPQFLYESVLYNVALYTESASHKQKGIIVTGASPHSYYNQLIFHYI